MRRHAGEFARAHFLALTLVATADLWGGAGCMPADQTDPRGSGGRTTAAVGSGGSGGGTSSGSGGSGGGGGATSTSGSGGYSGSNGTGGDPSGSGGAARGSGGTPLGSGGRAASGGTSTGGSGGTSTGGSSGGSSGGGTGGAADPNDPLNKRVSCSSGKRWNGGINENMAPGRPCLDCHPAFALAGTVYPTGHETDNCQGINDLTVTVVITDVHGDSVTLPTNTVGNFAAAGFLETPFTAKIVRGTEERRMLTPQTDTNCNNCHTAEGLQGAPGRIVAP